MRESDEPLTDTLVRCLADPMDLKALERLEDDGDQAGARLMRARLADQAAVRCLCSMVLRPVERLVFSPK
ncbi:hypothetical protein PMS81_06855, partial [Bifidobacterium longum]|nr:hypothetical protein [Bifidobacterium longum]MDB6914343.1 hypothetical protein [Bifidobacterium longum]